MSHWPRTPVSTPASLNERTKVLHARFNMWNSRHCPPPLLLFPQTPIVNRLVGLGPLLSHCGICLTHRDHGWKAPGSVGQRGEGGIVIEIGVVKWRPAPRNNNIKVGLRVTDEGRGWNWMCASLSRVLEKWELVRMGGTPNAGLVSCGKYLTFL